LSQIFLTLGLTFIDLSTGARARQLARPCD